MKLKNGKPVNHAICTAALLPTAALGAGLTALAPAAHALVQLEEVVVTARRTEEAVQNVPISMTVFNQETLNERNVVSGTDLANFTPSLAVNTRFGSDQATFAIRGFTQELRTAASVAIYFADVVAPRGSGSVTSGDGAGPGSFFDLQNVQVLKGPQGTLFGRNTTGGAIQLVPQEPTSELEGYLELSAGDYDMKRAQGVINVPISDMARARFGIDKLEREGHIDNASPIGPDHFLNVDYVAGRASLILELTDSVQNYTILTSTNSENNGMLMGLFACSPELLKLAANAGCQANLDAQGNDFYTVVNDTPDPISELKQWQAINTTTWEVNDAVTVKNILSYADLEQTGRGSQFGTNFAFFSTHLTFYPMVKSDYTSNSQTTFVEELQFSGVALDERLSWQAGLYYENSRPDGISGYMTALVMNCADMDVSGDPSTWNCQLVLPGSGSVTTTLGKTEFLNQAVYSQATYDITDEFKITAGLRYTVDETTATGYQKVFKGFPLAPAPGGAPNPLEGECAISTASMPDCAKKAEQKSEAPTWVIGVDYLPSSDVMVYAKYSRGYRQGAVNVAGPDGRQEHGPEEVDAYEIGAKTTFHALVSGTFNISAFYNELRDQQIQVGYQDTRGRGTPTTAIYNAGESTIQGVEIETTLLLTEGLLANVSYTYLETHLKEFEYPAIDPEVYNDTLPAAVEGGELTFSPRHNITAGLNYQLPVPADLGDMTIGATYTFVDQQYGTGNSPTYGEMDSHKLVNLNMGWKSIVGSAFDASLFVTNVTDEEWVATVPGMYDTFAGMEFRAVGEPRMYGARVKYKFGS